MDEQLKDELEETYQKLRWADADVDVTYHPETGVLVSVRTVRDVYGFSNVTYLEKRIDDEDKWRFRRGKKGKNIWFTTPQAVKDIILSSRKVEDEEAHTGFLRWIENEIAQRFGEDGALVEQVYAQARRKALDTHQIRTGDVVHLPPEEYGLEPAGDEYSMVEALSSGMEDAGDGVPVVMTDRQARTLVLNMQRTIANQLQAGLNYLQTRERNVDEQAHKVKLEALEYKEKLEAARQRIEDLERELKKAKNAHQVSYEGHSNYVKELNRKIERRDAKIVEHEKEYKQVVKLAKRLARIVRKLKPDDRLIGECILADQLTETVKGNTE